MAGLFLRWAANIIALVCVAMLVPGIRVETVDAMVITALVLGFLNAVVRPLIILFTLPLFIFSLGLVTLFVNALLFYFASRLVAGFHVADFPAAFWGALAFSIASFLINLLIYPAVSVLGSFCWARGGKQKAYTDVIDVTPERSGSEKES